MKGVGGTVNNGLPYCLCPRKPAFAGKVRFGAIVGYITIYRYIGNYVRFAGLGAEPAQILLDT